VTAAARLTAVVLASTAALATAGCSGHAADPAGVVVDQDTLTRITAVLDDTERVLDAVDQEFAADPQE
jgi:ABC-type glycerol-3-phosphate transport system substrate-binding protein